MRVEMTVLVVETKAADVVTAPVEGHPVEKSAAIVVPSASRPARARMPRRAAVAKAHPVPTPVAVLRHEARVVAMRAVRVAISAAVQVVPAAASAVSIVAVVRVTVVKVAAVKAAVSAMVARNAIAVRTSARFSTSLSIPRTPGSLR
jgi:hypothetical protein